MNRYWQNISLQQGQAMTEFLVICLVLLGFFIAVPWLGRLHDIDLQLLNASRYGAFQASRTMGDIDKEYVKQKFFLGTENNWRDRQQQRIVHAEQVLITKSQHQQLSDDMQAGMSIGAAKALRQGWDIQDKGIVKVNVGVRPIYSQTKQSSSGLGLDLGFWDRQVIDMEQHTAILIDAGHSFSDLNAHQRSASSARAWRDVANASYDLGKHIQRYAAPVDSGFNRAQPVFDWMVPWAGKLPSRHLQGQ